jgi:hypothetical protein
MAIAKNTGEGQVANIIRAAVLQADDMINLAAQKRVVLTDEAILTALVGTGGNKVTDLAAVPVTHE